MVLEEEVFLYDKILILSLARSGSTWAWKTFLRWDDRIDETVEDFEYYSNEPFDKFDDNGKILDFTQQQPYFVSKIHKRHIADNEDIIDQYVSLFDYRLLVLRNNLFETALSLSISDQKNRWGVWGAIPDDQITIDCKKLTSNVRSVWKDLNYMLSNRNRFNYNHTVWIGSQLGEDIDLWNDVTHNRPINCNKNKFINYISPDKKQVVLNWNECLQEYLHTEQSLSSDYSSVKDCIVYEN